jgi:hypothetical protein
MLYFRPERAPALGWVLHVLGPNLLNKQERCLVAKAESGAVRACVPGLQGLGEVDELPGVAADKEGVGIVEVGVVVDVPNLASRDVFILV